MNLWFWLRICLGPFTKFQFSKVRNIFWKLKFLNILFKRTVYSRISVLGIQNYNSRNYINLELYISLLKTEILEYSFHLKKIFQNFNFWKWYIQSRKLKFLKVAEIGKNIQTIEHTHLRQRRRRGAATTSLCSNDMWTCDKSLMVWEKIEAEVIFNGRV